jgi:hypothetical protein
VKMSLEMRSPETKSGVGHEAAGSVPSPAVRSIYPLTHSGGGVSRPGAHTKYLERVVYSNHCTSPYLVRGLRIDQT